MTLRRGIVLVLLGGALSALGCALVWFSAPVDSVVVREVAVTGSQVAPGAMPLLLVVAAGLVARAMTRGVVRRVIGWLGVLAWVGLVATLVAAALDPVGPLLAEAAEATGVGQARAPRLAARGPGSPWPVPPSGASVVWPWRSHEGSRPGAAGTSGPGPEPGPASRVRAREPPDAPTRSRTGMRSPVGMTPRRGRTK